VWVPPFSITRGVSSLPSAHRGLPIASPSPGLRSFVEPSWKPLRLYPESWGTYPKIKSREGGETPEEPINSPWLNGAVQLPGRHDVSFQDPFSSLNPRMTVMDVVSEPLMIHGIARRAELKSQVRELLEAVGLRAQHMNRYPYAFSGGQRQRIGVARPLQLCARRLQDQGPPVARTERRPPGCVSPGGRVGSGRH
jgi:hypothetical protein